MGLDGQMPPISLSWQGVFRSGMREIGGGGAPRLWRPAARRAVAIVVAKKSGPSGTRGGRGRVCPLS